MQYYLMMCRSLTYAQRAQRALDRAGVPTAVVKAPRAVSGGGCAYGVRVAVEKYQRAEEILRKTGLPMGKVYAYDDTGGLYEVRP